LGNQVETVPEHAEEHPEEHAEQGSEDDGRGRRRGRRGGRRRGRRDDGEASPYAAPGADQPDLAPVYIGPTPANPFGGQAFDIFDVLEQAEAAATAPESPAPMETVRPDQAVSEPDIVRDGIPEPATAEPLVGEELTEAAMGNDPPEVSAPAQVTEPEVTNSGGPEPDVSNAAISELVASEPTAAEPTPEALPEFTAPDAANDVAAEPAVKPILVGSGEEPGERKRGWWRK